MKKTIVLIAFLFSMFAAFAQTYKFGHVNSQELMTTLPEMDAAMGKLEELQTSNNELLTKMQEELRVEVEKYQNANPDSLTQAQRTYKEQQLQSMQEGIQKFYQDAQIEMQSKQQELTQPVMDKVRKAIDEVAKEQGFIYVFDLTGGAVLYHSAESVDIKPFVRKKLGLE